MASHSGSIQVHVEFPWVEMGVVIVAANVASMLLWVTCYHAAKGASKLALYVVWSLMLLAALIGLAIAANSIMNGSIGETLHRAWHSRFTDGILRTAQSAMSGVLNNNNPFANNNNNNTNSCRLLTIHKEVPDRKEEVTDNSLRYI